MRAYVASAIGELSSSLCGTPVLPMRAGFQPTLRAGAAASTAAASTGTEAGTSAAAAAAAAGAAGAAVDGAVATAGDSEAPNDAIVLGASSG